jgi:hypothetical protein
MNQFNITKVGAALFPQVNYLIRLRNRMHARGFPHDDPTLLARVRRLRGDEQLAAAHPLSVVRGDGEAVDAGAVTLSAINYKRVRGANDRVGVGFIGYGLIGKRHVARLRPRLGSFVQFGD